MSAKDYCIRPEYSENTVPWTDDATSGTEYWNPARLRASHSYQFPVYAYAERVIREKRVGSVIDVGCGPGTKLSMLHDLHSALSFTGVDLPNAIAFCQRTYQWGTWLAVNLEAESEPHDKVIERVDLAICSDVIEHLLDPDKVLDYLRRVVRPGGYAILSTPERDKLRGKDCLNSPHRYHVREWTREEFGAYLRNRGLTVCEQFLSFPMRYGLNSASLWEIAGRLAKARSLKWNQVCLLRID